MNKKIIRNLSGIYFRSKNEETGKYENIVFEDLSLEEQHKIMESKEIEFLKSMCIALSDTINKIGDKFNLMVD